MAPVVFKTNPESHYSKYGKKYYEKNKEREKVRNKEYYESNKDSVIKRTSSRSLKYRYGLSPEDLVHMHEQQNGVCAICGLPPKEGRNLDVDHNHDTGVVRALLCNNCNRGLGHFKDNPMNLLKALKYLTSFGNPNYGGSINYNAVKVCDITGHGGTCGV